MRASWSMSNSFQPPRFSTSRNHDKPRRRIRLFACASQVLGGKMPIRHQKASENFAENPKIRYCTFARIDHTPYIVDFRSAVELPYDHRSVANTDTCFEPNILGRACFFSVWRPVWTASALDNWQLRYSAPKLEDAIIRSAPWC